MRFIDFEYFRDWLVDYGFTIGMNAKFDQATLGSFGLDYGIDAALTDRSGGILPGGQFTIDTSNFIFDKSSMTTKGIDLGEFSLNLVLASNGGGVDNISFGNAFGFIP